jgi:hypothetical protein
MARDLPARPVLNGPQTVANGRDARGRFVAGAPPGPGRPVANPFGRHQTELRAALLAEVSPADIRTILRQVIKIAKRGHLPAIELLLKWTLGAPLAPIDPDKLDAHELEVRRSRPTLVDWMTLTDGQADREPAEHADAEADLDEPPAVEAEAPDALHPPLRTVLAWAVEELAQAQSALRLQRPPPPPDPQAGWETFAASRLEFIPEAAVEVDQLYLSYAKWYGSHGEPVLEEAKVMAALQANGARLRTGALSQCTMLVGVRVVV